VAEQGSSGPLSVSTAETLGRLDALASELAACGWASAVQTPRGKLPRLHARNPDPEAAALSEIVFALPSTEGTWAYWWPWREQIAERAADAAAVIVRVLRPAGTP
jgi:hypothetical protein